MQHSQEERNVYPDGDAQSDNKMLPCNKRTKQSYANNATRLP